MSIPQACQRCDYWNPLGHCMFYEKEIEWDYDIPQTCPKAYSVAEGDCCDE